MFAEFLGISDLLWQAIIAGAVTVILACMQQRTKSAVERTGQDAAIHVEEVKRTLEVTSKAKVAQLAKVSEDVADVKSTLESVTEEQNVKLDQVADDVKSVKQTLNGGFHK